MRRHIRTVNDDKAEIFSETDYIKLRKRITKAYTDDKLLRLEKELKTYRDFSSIVMNLDNDDARALLYSYEELVNDSLSINNIDKDDYKNLLLDKLKSDSNSVNLYHDIVMHKAKFHTPVNYLKWFKDDLRSSIFLASTLEESLKYKISKGGSELQQRIYDILRFDIDLFNNTNKIPPYNLDYKFMEENIRLKRLEYVKYQYLNCLCKPRDIKWIEKENAIQIDKIYTQLDKMGLIPLKTSFLPVSLYDKYALILVSLDRLCDLKSTKGRRNSGSVKFSRNEVIAKLKKNWLQKLTDDRKSTDKLIEVKIYKTNHQKMIELLKHKGKTPNQLVNEYIEQEYDRVLSDRTQEISKENKQKDKSVSQKSVENHCLPDLPIIRNNSKQKASPAVQEQINHMQDGQEQPAHYIKELNENFSAEMTTAEPHNNYQDEYQIEKQLYLSRRGKNR